LIVLAASLVLTGTAAFVACSSSATPTTDAGSGGDGGYVDAGLADARELADSGDAGACPDWTYNVPDGACSVPEGTECGGNEQAWGTFCWFRCCSGHWLGPATPDLCSLGGSPCTGWCFPDGGAYPVPCDGG
jgi:hypothetical protein